MRRFLTYVVLLSLIVSSSAPAESAGPTPAVSPLLSTLTDFRVVVLDADPLREASRNARAVEVDLGYETVLLMLWSQNALADNVTAFVEFNATHRVNVTVEPQPTYAGIILGDDGSTTAGSYARLILSEDGVEGVISTGESTYNLQAPDFVAATGSVVVYRDTDLKPWGEGFADIDMRFAGPLDADLPALPKMGPQIAALGSGTIRMALIADVDYANTWGGTSGAFNRMQNDLFLFTGAFSNEFGYVFEVTTLGIISQEAEGPSRDIGDQLSRFQTYMEALLQTTPDSGVWHAAQFFVGHDLTDSGVVFGAGSARAMTSRGAVSIVQETQELGYAPDQNSAHRKFAHAHELGHNMDGRHCLAHYVGSPSLTKTIMATWASSPDPAGEPDATQCLDEPSSTWLYSYISRFSTATGNNNAGPMSGFTTPRIAASATPAAPTAASSSGTVGVPVSITVFAPTQLDPACNSAQVAPWWVWYAEVSWGDGSTTTPAAGDGFCGTRQHTHTYSTSGVFEIRVRMKFGYFHPYSASSLPLSQTISGGSPPPPPGGADATLVPPNDGVGSGFDPVVNIGQNWPANVPAGTITKVCLYMKANTGAANYGVAVLPGSSPSSTSDVFTGTILAGTANGWACQSVSRPWSASSLFMHRTTGGTGEVGYRQNVNEGQGYDGTSGTSWNRQPTDDRGYKIILGNGGTSGGGGTQTGCTGASGPGSTSDTAVLVPANDGVGSGCDPVVNIGQNWPTGVPAGTVQQVCFFMKGGSGTANYGIAVTPGASPATTSDVFSGTITAGSVDGWACQTVSRSWTATSLFMHRTAGGTGEVGYRQNVAGGQGYDGTSGAAWIHQPTDNRGYKVVICISAACTGTITTLVPPNDGVGTAFDPTVNIGENWPAGVPAGTVIQVCFFMQGGTGSANYGIAVAPGSSAGAQSNVFTGTITAGGADGWACQDVNQAWTASSLFMHRTSGGTAWIGYRQNVADGQGYDGTSGTHWNRQPSDDRGYKVVIRSQ